MPVLTAEIWSSSLMLIQIRWREVLIELLALNSDYEVQCSTTEVQETEVWQYSYIKFNKLILSKNIQEGKTTLHANTYVNPNCQKNQGKVWDVPHSKFNHIHWNSFRKMTKFLILWLATCNHKTTPRTQIIFLFLNVFYNNFPPKLPTSYEASKQIQQPGTVSFLFQYALGKIANPAQWWLSWDCIAKIIHHWAHCFCKASKQSCQQQALKCIQVKDINPHSWKSKEDLLETACIL